MSAIVIITSVEKERSRGEQQLRTISNWYQDHVEENGPIMVYDHQTTTINHLKVQKMHFNFNIFYVSGLRDVRLVRRWRMTVQQLVLMQMLGKIQVSRRFLRVRRGRPSRTYGLATSRYLSVQNTFNQSIVFAEVVLAALKIAKGGGSDSS